MLTLPRRGRRDGRDPSPRGHVTSWCPTAGDERLYLSDDPASMAPPRSAAAFPSSSRSSPPKVRCRATASRAPPPGRSAASVAPRTAPRSCELVLRDSTATHAIWDATFKAIVTRGRLRAADGDHPRRGERRRRPPSPSRRRFTPTFACATSPTPRSSASAARAIAPAIARSSRTTPSGFASTASSTACTSAPPRTSSCTNADAGCSSTPRDFRMRSCGTPDDERAAALADLDPGGERHFVCVEAAAVQEPVTIGPRRRWTGDADAHRRLVGCRAKGSESDDTAVRHLQYLTEVTSCNRTTA